MTSETPFPVDATVQVHAPVWSGNTRSGRQMGVQFVMVLPDIIRTTARL
jgi:hypothetical protein